jgi:hypothetical protein
MLVCHCHGFVCGARAQAGCANPPLPKCMTLSRAYERRSLVILLSSPCCIQESGRRSLSWSVAGAEKLQRCERGRHPFRAGVCRSTLPHTDHVYASSCVQSGAVLSMLWLAWWDVLVMVPQAAGGGLGRKSLSAAATPKTPTKMGLRNAPKALHMNMHQYSEFGYMHRKSARSADALAWCYVHLLLVLPFAQATSQGLAVSHCQSPWYLELPVQYASLQSYMSCMASYQYYRKISASNLTALSGPKDLEQSEACIYALIITDQTL